MPPSAGPSSPDSNLLRVQSATIGRRLSDNELMMPPKIRLTHSSASSPGETSTGSLPIRRHSAIGPERRGSTCTNLSPPTVSISTSNGPDYTLLMPPTTYLCCGPRLDPPLSSTLSTHVSFSGCVYVELLQY
ncbi:hypothetical protein Pcinc_005312 [Petrolisthes cinctipes]|uniref:Uncharacterized protein n=1 Tax=Petrolisthes cinctipes TaxID=88211 RepID=A0AAE1L091_PETCI|nr:hypothetical protein Pcinc_005312 [Petrolisthes cinctipes]